MNVYSAIILCFVPFVTVFLLAKILIDDVSIVKELCACVLGLIAVLPVTVLQFFCGDLLLFKGSMFLSVLFRALVLYGLIEEGIKCGTLFLFPVKNESVKLVFVYSLIAGLFLGCFESVIYLINAIQKAVNRGGEILLHMIYLRTFTSIVIHTFCAGLLGMFVYSAKNKKPMWGAVFYAVLLHGLYDFFAIMQKPINYFSYAAILLLILQCRIFYVRAKEIQQ